MAETILSTIAARVLAKLGSLAVQEIGLARGIKSEIIKLEDTLSVINAVLLDAEKQQAKNHEVRDWLEKLKDVVYDVDDVLDEFSTEVSYRKMEIHGSMLKEVRNFFSRSNPVAFRSKIGHKIKGIRERLDKIATDRRDFHFTEQAIDARNENRVREQTHSFVRESDVIGRDYDKEKIVQLLLKSSNIDEGPSVIPIVGLGGLGKTTVAKLVYNDDRVVRNFELRMWVCVSDDFNLKKLLEKIVESVPGANCGYRELDPLQGWLQDYLNAKKYLLVLDDVWNEDFTKWADLKNLLMGGANGSKIIVTTRNMKVASITGTIPTYHLKGLSNDECLSILMKYAFKEGQEKGHPKLEEIGKAIVTKCGGIPLAVRTLGCLLCMKTEEREWLYIKDNDIWKLEQNENDILPALTLSYQQLPSHLKQCFAYCSIFPKDFKISSRILINYWMAQGFLGSDDGSQQLEDIGKKYFKELLSRSFFQEECTQFDSEILLCKMHDLVHDLAQLMASTECLNVDFNSKIIPKRVRHVSFSEYINFSEKEFPTSLLSAKKLRSFNFSYKVGPISKSFVDTLILRFRCLRLLDLRDSEFEELPSFVGNLKHLRYLDLSGNCSLKALPDSTCKLLNLQTLELSDCEQLQDLPRDIGKLTSLRHLYLTSQLICLPKKGLQGLTSLRLLTLYRCNHLTSLSEGIEHLTSLRKLRIDECQSLVSLPSGMKHLTALEKLEIWDCQELNLEDDDMQGLRSLLTLGIIGLPKLVALPPGLQQSAATLQFLDIENCPGLTTLSGWLQTLASLQTFYIRDCPNLLCLPEGMQRLTALQKLKIERCSHLGRRCMKETGEDWPKISHIPEIFIVSDEDLGQ